MSTAIAPASLTAKQAQILAFIRSFHRRNGFPPTFRIVMEEFGYGGTNSVMVHLKPLVRKGALRRVVVDGAAKYLAAVPEGCCPCCGRPI